MVKCVLISEQFGNIEEIETPLSSDMFYILKGPGTFMGQYEDLDVVVMKCRESFMDLSNNQNRLPPPYHDELVLGPILLVRMNQDAEPEDFTLEEYTRYFS
jgi:hypothetical protein